MYPSLNDVSFKILEFVLISLPIMRKYYLRNIEYHLLVACMCDAVCVKAWGGREDYQSHTTAYLHDTIPCHSLQSVAGTQKLFTHALI